MRLKKTLAIISAAALSLSMMTACGKEDSSSDSKIENADNNYKIGIVQIMEHNSLNTIRDAVKGQLEALGFKDGDNCTIDCKQANGESTTVTQILDQFKADGADVIVAITTPCAQLAAPYSADIPVVFSAVTDPIAAGVVDSLDNTGGNITGTSDALEISKILDFALKATPNIKTLGYLYNTGEDNSVSCLEKVKSYCKDKNIKLATYASRCIENEILMYLRRSNRIKGEISIDEPLNQDGDGNELLLSDILGTDPDITSRRLEEEVDKKLLRASIKKLNNRERNIMELRFGFVSGNEKTQKEVADIVGISQSYISRLEKRILKNIRENLEKIC